MNQNPNPKAFSYVRFSSKKQGGKDRDSYTRQTSNGDQWAAAHGLHVDPLSCQDLGVSAFRGRNAQKGALKLFLDEIKKPGGRVRAGDYLLLESMDRLSRMPPWDAFDLIKQIIDAGVVVVSVAIDTVYSKHLLNSQPGLMDILTGEIKAAHSYSRSISMRVGEAWKRKNKAVAEGARSRHSCPGWLKWDPETSTYRLIPERADIVRLIYHYFIHDGMSFKAICARLTADAVPCFGKVSTWKSNYVGVVLTERTVLGERTVGHYENNERKIDSVVPDYYPAVIDEDTWNAAQRLLREKSITDKRNQHLSTEPRVTNLFTRRLYCKICGSALVVHATRANGGHRYAVCRSRKMDGTCPEGARIRYDYLEHTVLGLLAKELIAADLVADDQTQQELTAAIASVERLERGVREKDAEMSQLARSVATPGLTDGAMQAIHVELNRVDNQTQQLKRDLDAARTRANQLHAAIRNVEGNLEEIRRLADESGFNGRRRLRAAIASLVDKVVVDSRGSKQIIVHFRTGVVRHLNGSGPFRLPYPEKVRVLDLDGKPTKDTVEWDELPVHHHQVSASAV